MRFQYVWSLTSAFALAWAAVLQHREARAQPAALALTPALLRRLARRPLWLVGGGVELAGVGAQALALRAGPVVTVQALKTTSVVFALVLAAPWRPPKLGAIDIALVAALIVGMSTFLAVAQPAGSTPPTNLRPWLAAIAVTVIVVAGALVVAHATSDKNRSLALGVATGTIWALTAVLLKATVAEIEHHGILALVAWPPWALAVGALGGTIVNQTAFQSGDLIRSLPAISVVEPLLGTMFGVIVYAERLRARTPLSWVLLLGGGALALASTALLGRNHAARTRATSRQPASPGG